MQFMQLIEPTADMAELMYYHQSFYLESPHLQAYIGEEIMKQKQLYVIHYCSLIEKSQFLRFITALFYDQDITPADMLYIDNQHNYNIYKQAYIAKCYSQEDIVVQLNSARYLMKKNRKIRLVIIDSVNHWQSKYKANQNKRKSGHTIGEKIIHYHNEICLVIDELIETLRAEFNAIIIVLSMQTQMNSQIKLLNQQVHCSRRVMETIQNNGVFLFSGNFVDYELFELMYAKNYQNDKNEQCNTCLSILESNGKYIYTIFDDKKLIDKGEIQLIQ